MKQYLFGGFVPLDTQTSTSNLPKNHRDHDGRQNSLPPVGIVEGKDSAAPWGLGSVLSVGNDLWLPTEPVRTDECDTFFRKCLPVVAPR